MVNVFVLDVLETFQREEKEEFRIFLQSLYFNRGPNRESLIALLEVLLHAQERGEMDEMEQETIFKLLFPNKVYVENKVLKLISELKRLLQVFMTSRRYHSPKNELVAMLDFAVELRHKGLNARYQQTIEKIRKESNAQPWNTREKLFLKHLIALEEREWHSIFNKAKGDLNLPNTIKHLDNYYLTLKTELINQLLLQQKMAVLSADAVELLQDNWDVPQQYLVEANALLNINWNVYQLLKETNPDAAHARHFLQILQHNEARFSPEKLVEFYAYLRNICSFLIDAGKLEFLQVLHEIQKDNLERGYFYHDEKIFANACLSITQTAIHVHALDWANTFVETHKNRIIDENETADFYRMNRALCLFAEKKYDDALESIPFGSSYSFYHLMARRLELKIFYETQSELLPYKIDAFKMFISRAGNKVLPETLSEHYVNFINLLRQISLSPVNQGGERSEKMIKRIHEKKWVAERTWLLEKARELGERKK